MTDEERELQAEGEALISGLTKRGFWISVDDWPETRIRVEAVAAIFQRSVGTLANARGDSSSPFFDLPYDKGRGGIFYRVIDCLIFRSKRRA